MKLDASDKELEQRDVTTMNLKPGEPVPKPPKPRSEEEIISHWGNDSGNPVISISCITYNHEKYIKGVEMNFSN